MRHSDITAPYHGIASHPYLATITIAPTDAGRLLRMAKDQPEVVILGVDQSTPDAWVLYACCASREGRDLLESNW